MCILLMLKKKLYEPPFSFSYMSISCFDLLIDVHAVAEEVVKTLPPSFDSCLDLWTMVVSDDEEETRLNRLLMPFMKLRFSVSLLSCGDFSRVFSKLLSGDLSKGRDSMINTELLADVLLSLLKL